jgi:hypothetical protein
MEADDAPVEPAPPQPRWMRSNRMVDPHAGKRAIPYAGQTFREPTFSGSALASPPAFAEAVRHDEASRHETAPHEAEVYNEAYQQPQPAQQGAAYDAERYDDVLYGADPRQQHGQDSQYQQYGQAAPDDGEYDPNTYPPSYEDYPSPRRRRSGVVTVAAVFALAVVGTAAAYGYRSYKGVSRTGEPPVIKAEATPIKVVPPTSADASGKIVDRIAGMAPGTERVVSREEQPMDVTAQTSPRVVFPPLNQTSSPPSVAAPQTQANAARTNGVMVDEPRKVRTLSIRPDQPDATPAPRQPVPRAQQVASAPAASTNAPMSLSPQAAAPAVAAARGGYVVQIAAQRSETDAQTSFRNMQAKYPSILGSRSALIRRVDLGQKGVYYRAMVGPFASSDEASHLCGSLKAAGGQCVVQRN